jgi:hypothetical protein
LFIGKMRVPGDRSVTNASLLRSLVQHRGNLTNRIS